MVTCVALTDPSDCRVPVTLAETPLRIWAHVPPLMTVEAAVVTVGSATANVSAGQVPATASTRPSNETVAGTAASTVIAVAVIVPFDSVPVTETMSPIARSPKAIGPAARRMVAAPGTMTSMPPLITIVDDEALIASIVPRTARSGAAAGVDGPDGADVDGEWWSIAPRPAGRRMRSTSQ